MSPIKKVPLSWYNIAIVLFVCMGGLSYGFCFSVFATSIGQPGFYAYFSLDGMYARGYFNPQEVCMLTPLQRPAATPQTFSGQYQHSSMLEQLSERLAKDGLATDLVARKLSRSQPPWFCFQRLSSPDPSTFPCLSCFALSRDSVSG